MNNISGGQEITILCLLAVLGFFSNFNFPFRFAYGNYPLLGMATESQNNLSSVGSLLISSVRGTSHRSNSFFWTLA